MHGIYWCYILLNCLYLKERTVETFKFHEFPISFLWFLNFNYVNSCYRHKELTKTRFWLHKFTILTSQILNYNFINSSYQIHVFTISCIGISVLRKKYLFIVSRFVCLARFFLSRRLAFLRLPRSLNYVINI
jgi:hypothetical protein